MFRKVVTKHGLHLLEIKLNFRNLSWSYWHFSLDNGKRGTPRRKTHPFLQKHFRHFTGHPFEVVPRPLCPAAQALAFTVGQIFLA